VDAEVAVFPKGHVAIATSWSLPTSECSLDRCFLDYRGPVRFQLDLEGEGDKALKTKPPKRAAKASKAASATAKKAKKQEK